MRRKLLAPPSVFWFIFSIPSHLGSGEWWLDTMVQALTSLDWQWWNLIGLPLSLALAVYALLPERIANRLYVLFRTGEPNSGSEEATEDLRGINYIDACGIIDRYIRYGIIDVKPGVVISIRAQILKRFENSTGAMLGEGIYNGEQLRYWMESNAAKLLVNNRGKLQ